MLGNYSDLAGKIAVLTGGSRGIGAETARMLAAQQSQVCVVGRDEQALDAVVAEISAAGGTAVGAVADVTSAAALAEVAALVEREFGRVDVLGVFAGGMGYPTPSSELSEELWRRVLDSDLTSAFLTVRAFLPMLLAQGSGSVVTMASSAGRQPSQANLAYGVANAGIIMMTRHLAAELGPRGIRVNAIAPSSILTEKVAANMPEAVQRQMAASHPLRRMGFPADVALAALFLASDASSYPSGITIDVAGGRITN
ncbi:SDR family NAD(P)-dependent oxidoreductase [Nocardia seriolae]|uniref:2,3-dihydro-2,3-dihydroxybenzoate dehydrogenase n=1 Tax=Nocardia seriolae TaxID=37332 RepID=A0ABC8B442_9NOCA|nr:SDR family NAD(P)-dependent oxidoreductase [Nocardia seriolae]APB01097.1 2,3-dihydro-2,3-dihydroxybenzoate dehydrogenase [Nocardia seriolae]OJF82334.1 short-chain dehydrogenase [Nocardia seriolae]PSK29880.1 SDR family NAD(P)-dependent oxidoreductase [Nocardia seriolae]QOW33083.1 SDR family oxidoreductase [Nocardia seriolae]QUN14679.1 SDR family oxidoreductase [Nocardia seriolae]